MKKTKLGLVLASFGCVSALGIGAVISGCQSAPAPAKDPVDPTPTALVADADRTSAQWAELYPNQYSSFAGGAQNIEVRDYDNRSHSHFLLPVEMGAFFEDSDYTVRCMGCHSSWFKEITDEYGHSTEVLDSLMKDYADEFPNMEFWDCRTCHEDNPQSAAHATNIVFLAASNGYSFPTADTACGQCHSITAEDMWELDWNTIDEYRNGVSCEGLWQTMMESEAAGTSSAEGPVTGFISYDPKTGIKKYGEGSVVDLEVFQGSTHQNLGLTCASCHMPQSVAADGTVYTNHDASGSPLEKPEALEYCLTCHSAQGISTSEAMVDFVLGKQGELAEGQLALREELAQLKAAIVEAMESGDVDEEILEQARMAWSHGRWNLRYTYGHEGENVGKKVAHNYEAMMTAVAQGRAYVAEGLALLGK